MAGLVSSVCTNEWMEVIMAAPVWNRSVHFDSVTSPALPILLHTGHNQALHWSARGDVENIFIC